MSFGTREDAEIMAQSFAKIILKIPKKYRNISIGGIFILQILGIYYLQYIFNKN
jgi:hypothetical protein